jgi:hypothetical protein
MRLTEIESWTRRNRYRMEKDERKEMRAELYRTIKIIDETLK